jgi:hypothetical protein
MLLLRGGKIIGASTYHLLRYSWGAGVDIPDRICTTGSQVGARTFLHVGLDIP